jgi:FkbM family methyltransferase
MNHQSMRLYNWEIVVPNVREYHILKREIFSEHRYYFDTNQEGLLIVDIGAHIGLSTLYFKRLFPQSTVIAYEPHPESFALLKHNVEFNQLSNVIPINQAVWSDTNPLTLYADSSQDKWWSTSGIHAAGWDGSQPSTKYQANTTTLKNILSDLDQPIDLLKIDAEGAEWDILFTNRQNFDRIKAVVVEFHPEADRELAEFIQNFPSNFSIALDKKGQPAKKNLYQGGLITLWAVKK